MTKLALQRKHNFIINVAKHIGYPREVELTLNPVIHHSEKLQIDYKFKCEKQTSEASRR